MVVRAQQQPHLHLALPVTAVLYQFYSSVSFIAPSSSPTCTSLCRGRSRITHARVSHSRVSRLRHCCESHIEAAPAPRSAANLETHSRLTRERKHTGQALLRVTHTRQAHIQDKRWLASHMQDKHIYNTSAASRHIYTTSKYTRQVLSRVTYTRQAHIQDKRCFASHIHDKHIYQTSAASRHTYTTSADSRGRYTTLRLAPRDTLESSET